MVILEASVNIVQSFVQLRNGKINLGYAVLSPIKALSEGLYNLH